MVSPVAKFVVAVGLDGRIISQGTLEEALQRDPKLKAQVKKAREQMKKEDQIVDPHEKVIPKENNSEGKLIVAEEVALGRVSWPARM